MEDTCTPRRLMRAKVMGNNTVAPLCIVGRHRDLEDWKVARLKPARRTGEMGCPDGTVPSGVVLGNQAARIADGRLPEPRIGKYGERVIVRGKIGRPGGQWSSPKVACVPVNRNPYRLGLRTWGQSTKKTPVARVSQGCRVDQQPDFPAPRRNVLEQRRVCLGGLRGGKHCRQVPAVQHRCGERIDRPAADVPVGGPKRTPTAGSLTIDREQDKDLRSVHAWREGGATGSVVAGPSGDTAPSMPRSERVSA